MTKCGRVTANEFDYSPPAIRASVERSLQRFSTSYFDVIFAHDVEFVSTEEVFGAVKTLFELKDEGKIHFVGISGYPVALLADLAVEIREKLGRSVDVVQTYCHMNIQNTKLETYLGKMYDAGVGSVCNASPLCLGLLRKEGVPIGELGDFHPAPRGLREAAAKAAEWVEEKGENMASLSLRYAVGKFASLDDDKFGITILGGGSIEEIRANAETAQKVLRSSKDGSEFGDLRDHKNLDEEAYQKDQPLFEGVQKILGEWMDYTWDSPDAEYIQEQERKKARDQ